MASKEYRTTNQDLAAALAAYGFPAMLETYDGFEVEYVFSSKVSDAVKDWYERELKVEAKALSAAMRRIRIESKKVCEQYGRSRVPIKKAFSLESTTPQRPPRS